MWKINYENSQNVFVLDSLDLQVIKLSREFINCMLSYNLLICMYAYLLEWLD